jgi:hypothetical protein
MLWTAPTLRHQSAKGWLAEEPQFKPDQLQRDPGHTSSHEHAWWREAIDPKRCSNEQANETRPITNGDR